MCAMLGPAVLFWDQQKILLSECGSQRFQLEGSCQGLHTLIALMFDRCKNQLLSLVS